MSYNLAPPSAVTPSAPPAARVTSAVLVALLAAAICSQDRASVRAEAGAAAMSSASAGLAPAVDRGTDPAANSGATGAEVVGYWRFNEPSGTSILDSSGYANDGTAGETEITGGYCGSGRLTPASPGWIDGYWRGNGITVPSSQSLDISGTGPEAAFTVEAFVYAPEYDYTGVAIVHKPGQYTLAMGSFGAQGIPYFDINGTIFYEPGTHIPLNRWVHLAGTWDGTTARFYIDGVLANAAPFSGPIPASASPLNIAGIGTFPPATRTRVDEVRVTRKALEPSAFLRECDAEVPGAFRIAISDSGVVSGSDTLLRMIDSNGQLLSDRSVGALRTIEPFALSSDGSRVVYDTWDGTHRLRLHDFTTGQTRELLTGGWGFNALTWLQGSTSKFLFVSTVSGDGNIQLYDLDTNSYTLWQSQFTVAEAIGREGYAFRNGIVWDATFKRVVLQVGQIGSGGDGILVGDLCDLPGRHVCNLRVVDMPPNWGSPVSYHPTLTAAGDAAYFGRWNHDASGELVRHDFDTGTTDTLLVNPRPPSRPQLFDHDTKIAFIDSQHGDRDSVVVCTLSTVACRTIYRAVGPILHLQVLVPALPSPTANAGPERTVEATGADGAQLTLDGSGSTTPDGSLLAYTWTGPFPEGGGTVTGVGPTVTLPIGVSTVTLTVTNGQGNSASGTVAITVRDTTPPTLTLPSDLEVETASPQGAVVLYATSATDEVDGSVSVNCTPVSGSIFPIQHSDVVCSATDHAGNQATGGFTVTVRDTTPPVVHCSSADSLWHGADVVLTCSAADSGSGLADDGLKTFTLATNVPAGTETAGAAIGSQKVCDMAGNCVTVGPFVGIKVDKKAPALLVSAPVAGNLTLHQVLAAAYSCSDSGSGVASCVGTVVNGSGVDTATPGAKTFTVTASDQVGNQSVQSVTYSVVYKIGVLYDQGKARQSGSTIPIKIQLQDVNGVNVSAADVAVVAVGISLVSTNAPGPLDDSGNANPDGNFRFAGDSYIFNLKTTGLGTGTYALYFRCGVDPTLHTVQFQIR